MIHRNIPVISGAAISVFINLIYSFVRRIQFLNSLKGVVHLWNAIYMAL